jgi:hypothetical protein
MMVTGPQSANQVNTFSGMRGVMSAPVVGDRDTHKYMAREPLLGNGWRARRGRRGDYGHSPTDQIGRQFR